MTLEYKPNLFPKVSDFLDCLVVVLDLQGRIVYYNKYCENITDLPFSSKNSYCFWDLFCLEDEKELYKAFFARIEPDLYPLEIEAQIPGKDNNTLTILWKYNSLKSDNEEIEYHVLTGTDITSYKNTNKKLQEIGEKYRTVIHVSPVSVITMDPLFKIKSWSSAAEKLLGWKEKSVSESDILSVIEDKDGGLKKCCERAIRGEIINNFELTSKRKDGNPVIINCFFAPMRDFNGTVDGIVLIALDITERKKTELDLYNSENRYREIIESMEDGYYEVDLNGKILSCNKAAARMIGYEVDELIGMSYKSLCNDFEKVYSVFNQSFQENKPNFSVVMEMICKDGTISNADLSLSLSRDRDGGITGFRGLGRDITDRIKSDKKLRYLSYHDTLTGVYNRTFFEKELERLEGSNNYPITIILADLDGLKLVNDTLGHKEGDRYLKTCSDLLKNSLRNSDFLSRIGGDEFALILPKTSLESGELLIKRIRNSMEIYNKTDPQLPLSISMGLAVSKKSDQPLEETLRYADGVMYSDKLNSSNKARENIIKALLASLYEFGEDSEERDDRLHQLSNELGKRAGLDEEQLSNLQLLIQVHQLGMVTVPKNIINKQGKLTEEEWQVVRQHAERGYRIAGASPDLSAIADLILKHHECWDGSGYPLGLKGEEIPIQCRIIAITDAFISMTNHRHYAAFLSKSKAIKELKRCSGNKFDPNLTVLFLQIIRK